MKKKVTPKVAKKITNATATVKFSLEDEVGRNTVMLEEMRDNFKVFSQEIVALNKKTDVIFDEVGALRVDLNQVRMRLDSLEDDVTNMRKEFKGARLDLGTIKDEVKFIKLDVGEIKKTLTTKADMKHLSLFEARVARLEKKLA